MFNISSKSKLVSFFYLLPIYKTKHISTKKSNTILKLDSALNLQKENSFDKALILYQQILQTSGSKAEIIVIYNNITICLYKLKRFQEAKKYFSKLFTLQQALYFTDYEQYAIDYAYTITMGIEWFGLKKEDYSSFLENVIKDFYFLEDAKRLQKIIQSL